MAYAKELTKEELIKNGIEVCVEDGHLKVYRNGKECKLSKTPDYYVCPKLHCNKKRQVTPYYTIWLYVFNDAGNRIKVYKQYKSTNWVYKIITVTLQRVVWAWYNGTVPAGYLVDHISNKHDEVDDYLIENLQLLSPFDNIHKDSTKNYNRQLQCSLKKPLSHYETKLAKALALYLASTGLEKHKYNNDCARYRAYIRYWKAHNGMEAQC